MKAWLDPLNINPINFSPIFITATAVFCSNTTYIASNVPSGTAVSWSASPAGVVSLSPSGNQVTLSKFSLGNFTLTATSLGSITTSRILSTQPQITAISENQSGSCNGLYQTWQLIATANTTASSWTWSISNGFNGSCNIQSPNSPNTYVSVTGGGGVNVTFQDQCGVMSPLNGVTIYSNCSHNASMPINIYPNPTSSVVKVDFNSVKSSNGVTAIFLPETVDLFNQKTARAIMTLTTSDLIKQNNIALRLGGASFYSLDGGERKQFFD